MKHTMQEGKWKPNIGTFVRVTNDQIPEVIQMLRDHDMMVWKGQDESYNDSHNVVVLQVGGWFSGISGNLSASMNLSDFKALVTGILPDSWCIRSTPESRSHPDWKKMCRSIYEGIECGEEYNRQYYYVSLQGGSFIPKGEIIQIETWAALNESKEAALSIPVVPAHTPTPWKILRAPNEGWGRHFLVVGSNYDKSKDPLKGVVFHAFDSGQPLPDWEFIVESVNKTKL